jgi:hypothetical protein
MGSFSGRYWVIIACSKDGKYILAGSSDTSTSGGATRTLIQKSSDYGVTVTTETLGGRVPGNVSGAGMSMAGISNDGQYQTIFLGASDNSHAVSSDYGSTFTVYTGSTSVSYDPTYSISISDNGQYQLANYNGLSISTDYGVNWTQKYTGGTEGTCMSSTGQYQYSSIGTGILKSTDYGSSFTIISGFTANRINGIDCDNTGKIIYVTTYNSGTYSILKSIDYGNNWTTLQASIGGDYIKISN